MTRYITLLGLLLVLLATSQPATGQFSRASFGSSGLVPTVEANRFGLDRVWHTQIALDRARGRIAHITQHISSVHSQTIFRVVSDDGNSEYSERALDNFGMPLGKLGAVKRAAERMADQIRLLLVRKPDGIDEAALAESQQAAQQVVQNVNAALTADPPGSGDVELDGIIAPLMRLTTATPDATPRVEMHVIPDITLFVTTDSGMLHAIDGETGQTRWTTPVGHRNSPGLAPVANDDYVAIINGSVLYLFDYVTGKLVWERWMQGVAGAPPGMSDTTMYIPTFSGHVEVYQIYRAGQRTPPPFKVYSSGRGMVQPTVMRASVGWPTDRGFFYVADAIALNKRFRLEAHRTIVSRASYAPGRFLVSSIDGFVYCVNEFTGELYWRFSAGIPISHTPVVIGEYVYVIVDDGGMYRVSVETGVDQWWSPGVKRFIAASEERVYVTNRLGRMMILHAETGGQIGSFPTEELDLQLVNWQTDRMFVGKKTGAIQCLRELDQVHPLFHVAVEGPTQPQAAGDPQDRPADAPADVPAGPVNPFGTGTSPFGGGTPAGGAGDSPFGGGAGTDPFGGGGAGGDNPFGGPAGGAGGAGGGAGNPFGGPSGSGGVGGDNPFGGP